jgi:hypothetical protein
VRSCASVFVIPRRKMSLCEALHGSAAMARVKAPWPSHGELAGEGGEGRGGERSRGARLGAPWGGVARSNSLLVAALRVFCFLREKKTTGRREEREEKEEEKEKKEKNGRNL